MIFNYTKAADRKRRIILRIGIVLSAYYEGSLGVVIRVVDLIKSLTNLNVEVHVFSPFNIPELENMPKVTVHILENVISKLKLSRTIYKMLQYCLGSPTLSRKIMLRKWVISSIVKSFSGLVYSKMKEIKLDLIQGEQEIASLACLRLKDKLNVPVVSSLHNIWPEELVASGIIEKSSHQFHSLMNMEREIVENSDMVIVLSEAMKDYIRREIGSKGKIVVVPLGSRPQISEVEYVSEPNRVVHAGLMSKLDNVGLFVESMPYIKRQHPKVSFYLTRKGEAYPSVKKYLKKIDVKPNFFWYSNKNHFLTFLKSCHVGVVTSKNHITRKFGFTMKFFDYLSVGIPVVANDIGGWTKIIEQEKIGVLTESTPEAFGKGVVQLLQNPEMRYELGKRCLELSKTKFNIDRIAVSLKEQYHRLI